MNNPCASLPHLTETKTAESRERLQPDGAARSGGADAAAQVPGGRAARSEAAGRRRGRVQVGCSYSGRRSWSGSGARQPSLVQAQRRGSPPTPASREGRPAVSCSFPLNVAKSSKNKERPPSPSFAAGLVVKVRFARFGRAGGTPGVAERAGQVSRTKIPRRVGAREAGAVRRGRPGTGTLTRQGAGAPDGQTAARPAGHIPTGGRAQVWPLPSF